MTIIKDVLAELFSMFVSDARLSIAILAVVACAAIATRVAGPATLLAGGILLTGSIIVLIASVRREAKRRK
jgi:hypothetical protein